MALQGPKPASSEFSAPEQDARNQTTVKVSTAGEAPVSHSSYDNSLLYKRKVNFIFESN